MYVHVLTPYVYSLHIFSHIVQCTSFMVYRLKMNFTFVSPFSDPIYFRIEMWINTLMLVFPRIGKENRTLTVISIPEFGLFFLQKLEIMGGDREGRSVFRKLIILFDLAAVYRIGLKSHRSNYKNFIYWFLSKSAS